MVHVRWNGRLGNQLFEYAIGRIIAEELGYELLSDPLPGFPHTGNKIYGNVVHPIHMLEGQSLDMNFIYSNKDKLGFMINGWFQRYEYYEPFKDRIKLWFKTDLTLPPVKDNDVIIHIRRTQHGEDYKIPYDINGCTYMMSPDLLSFEWYDGILKTLDFNQLYICTDMPFDPFLYLFKKYKPIIKSNSTIEDFCLIKQFRRIVMSQSTFSWWAAFLSDATDIYMPRTTQGCWAEKSGSDVYVNESRYHIINAERIGTYIYDL